MTFSQKRRVIRAPSKRKTFAEDLTEALKILIDKATSLSWPNSKYSKNPVKYCHDILGFEPWAKQQEVMNAVVNHPLVSVKSGHRIGKSWLAAALALWFYSTFPDARVIGTGPTSTNVQGVLWRAVRQLHARSGRCLKCMVEDPSGAKPCEHSTIIDSKPAERAATGLVSEDFREIKGYTVRDVEAITGTAGQSLFFIMDEASGVPDQIYEGLEGNRAGWTEEAGVMVRMLLIGNPTRTVGEFYDSHEHPRKKKVYARFTISSRDTPNVIEKRNIIPGLATHYWVEQMVAKYGEDSAFIKVRVDGEFPIGEDGKAFSIALITEAEERWDETEATGILQIGLDPAGESGTGDQTGIVARRGQKIVALRRFRGLNEQAHCFHIMDLIEELRDHPREKAIVVIDSEGKIGWDTYVYLRQVASKRDSTFELYRVRASDKAFREPMTFDRVRDELVHNLYLWLRDGGALIEDEQLETELHAVEWDNTSGKLKITPKKQLRKILGRSPDSFDALTLSCWPVLRTQEEEAEEEEEEDFDDIDLDPYAEDGIDPYA